MNNTRTYKIIIMLLVALNLGTLAFMWFNRPGRERQERRQGEAASFLIKELGLSVEQQKEYGRLRQEHRSMLDQLNERDKVLHNRFFALLTLEKPDTVSMEAIASAIAANRKNMEIVTYDHFYKVTRILNPEQQKKFSLIFKDVLRMVLPPPVPPPAPPPPPPPSAPPPSAPPPPPPPPGL